MLNSPELIHEALVTKADHFEKHEIGRRVLARALGLGLFTSEGALHRRQRKLVQPGFNHRRLGDYARVMARHGERLAREWEARLAAGDTRIELTDQMHQLTMAIVTEALFAVSIDPTTFDVGGSISELQSLAMQQLGKILPHPNWLPTAHNRRVWRERRALDAVVLKMIAERRRDGGDHGDLLSALIQATDEQGHMSDRQLRDEMVTLFAAGHETTANALVWTFDFLARHPAVEARLVDELDAVLGGRTPDMDDVDRLPFTEAVLKESMRLRPPVWVINLRQVTRDCRLGDARPEGGWTLKKGSSAFISPYALHRNVRLYENPDRFDPDRWLDGRTADLHRHAWLPFGAGHRVCIGARFAMIEGIVLLACLLQRVRLQRFDHTELPLEPRVTLSPKGGLPMQLSARRSPVGA